MGPGLSPSVRGARAGGPGGGLQGAGLVMEKAVLEMQQLRADIASFMARFQAGGQPSSWLQKLRLAPPPATSPPSPSLSTKLISPRCCPLGHVLIYGRCYAVLPNVVGGAQCVLLVSRGCMCLAVLRCHEVKISRCQVVKSSKASDLQICSQQDDCCLTSAFVEFICFRLLVPSLHVAHLTGINEARLAILQHTPNAILTGDTTAYTKCKSVRTQYPSWTVEQQAEQV